MSHSDHDLTPAGEERRTLMGTVASFGMWIGLAGGYGAFGVTAVRYLFPDSSKDQGWVFVADVASLPVGASMTFKTPSGASAAVTHLTDTGKDTDFLALSDTCPHLGCKVHWEAHNNRFFCPCHNGVFTPGGVATSGPPADAKQNLLQFPLKIDRGRLFMQVSMKRLPGGSRA